MTKLRYFRLYLIAVIISYGNINVHAQDVHFSQFYATPLLLNPGYTGMSGGNMRVANNYRNQWSRIGVPYKTLYTSLDKRVPISGQSFGIGGLLVHDQASAYHLSTNIFLVSVSYSKVINNHQFTLGIQPGFGFKSFNSEDLTFASQFDQSRQQFNSSFPSFERDLEGNLHYFDMNIGILWRTLIRNIMPSAGFSISHLLKPAVTFSAADTRMRLPMKLTFNGQVNIPLSQKFDIAPGVLYSSLPGTSELLLGGTGGYTINSFFIPIKQVYTVTMLRLNPFRNSDAMIIGGGVKFSKFDMGITYDFNISPLAKASSFNGAFEISLIFTGGNSATINNSPCRIY